MKFLTCAGMSVCALDEPPVTTVTPTLRVSTNTNWIRSTVA